ncbi:hypothetical protein BC830DRAFT_1175680 [Chytriomyces sp. MP71]|nr:hypothetical protein BC830DRAFT_1175680 [Chytriomyces sp. MP71]
MVGATHSSAAVTAKSMGGILEKPAATANVTVLDDEGNDVTPISLTQTKSSHFKPSLMQGTDLFASAIKESVADVLNDLESMNLASWSSSQFGGGRRSASSSGRASDVSESDEKDTDSASGCSSGDSIDGRFLSATHRASADGVAKFGAASRREDDAGSTAHVHLLETGHVTLLAIPSLAVCSDFAEDAAAVRTANASYAQLCATKANNENFADRGMQTIGASRKNKDVQASGPAHASAECQVSLWELYDAYNDPSASRGPDAVSSADDPVVSALQSASVIQSNANNAALSQIITASDSIAGMRSNAAMSTRSFLANSMSVDGSESDRFSVVGRAVGSGAEGDSVMDRLTENGDREAALLATKA